MKKFLFPAIGLLVLTGLALSENTVKQHNLMPVPQMVDFGDGRFIIDRDFTIELTGACGGRTEQAATRLLRRLSGRTGYFIDQGFVYNNQSIAEPKLMITCERTGELVLGEDESYSLNIQPGQIEINAPTEFGVLHAIESLLQLFETDGKEYYFPEVKIEDAPRFPWRGLMLDVCRHFIPLEVIKRNIDAMAAVKMNVLHLHLSEDQGFRVESKIYPQLHLQGSDGEYFTQVQMREIIDYADERGIRVIPEFDMPGHATAWFVGHPELSSYDTTYNIERGWGVQDPVMDPTRESTFEFLDAFIGEMAALFPDAYFHIGGDENNGVHWAKNEAIQLYMQEHGYETTHQLQSYFTDRVRQIVEGHGKIMIGWDEIFDSGMNKNIISQIWSWGGMKQLPDILNQDFQVIISNGYYIDLFWSTETHYLKDPARAGFVDDVALEKNILGGEVPSWAEFNTVEVVDARIWPRTAALAERFWSPKEVRDVDDMYRRLERVSFQLEELGIQHIRNYEMMLRRLTNNHDISSLKLLAGNVEPIEGYQRHRFDSDRTYLSYSPLTRLVDAVQSDAMVARKFRKTVANYLQEWSILNEAAEGLKGRKRKQHFESMESSPERIMIVKTLTIWQANHAELIKIIDSSPILSEIETISLNLSVVSKMGLVALTYLSKGKSASATWTTTQLNNLELAAKPEAELELRIVSAVEDLVRAAGNRPRETDEE